MATAGKPGRGAIMARLTRDELKTIRFYAERQWNGRNVIRLLKEYEKLMPAVHLRCVKCAGPVDEFTLICLEGPWSPA